MQSIPDRTFQFAVRIIKLCQHLEESGGVGRTIGRQLLRSGTSIGANVQEGLAFANGDFGDDLEIVAQMLNPYI